MTDKEAVGLFEDAPSDYNVRYDVRKDAKQRDYGSIGETNEGIWVRRHPEILLITKYPELVGIVDEFQAGQTTLTPEDFDTLAAPAYDAKLIMVDTLMRMKG